MSEPSQPIVASTPATGGTDAGSAAVRRVLGLVAASYLHPERVSARVLLEGALAAAGRRLPGLSWRWDDDGRVHLTGSAGSRTLSAGGAAPLADTLAPALDALLDMLAPRDVPHGSERNAARAALLDGALRALDRWSSASSGRTRRNVVTRHAGQLAGVGLALGRRDGRAKVLGVVPHSGAAKADVQTGDVLLAVDGAAVEDLTITDVIGKLRGAAGTDVSLLFERTAPATTCVRRQSLVTQTVARCWARPGVGVLHVRHLSQRTGMQVRAARDAMSAGGPLRGLVMDLRGNTGGSMLAAAAIADLFLVSGTIAQALDAADRPVAGLCARVDATPGGDLATPIAVLVNERSGSSSELLAAALAWNDCAILVGARTFGKVVVGKLHHFEDCDLTVKLTSATMRAAGRPLPSEGIEPDVPVLPSDAAPCPAPSIRGDLRAHDIVGSVADLLLRHGRPTRCATLHAIETASAEGVAGDASHFTLG